jgi:hypothetical protein
VSLICCSRRERGKARPDMIALVRVVRGSVSSGRNRKRSSTVAGCAGGLVRSSDEASVMEAERRGRAIRGCVRSVNWAVRPGGTAWTS